MRPHSKEATPKKSTRNESPRNSTIGESPTSHRDSYRPADPSIPPFRAHPLFRGPHLQTFFAYYLPHRAPRYRAITRPVTLGDGHQLIIHVDTPPTWQRGGPLVLLVPGMGGTHRSPFMVRLAARLESRGFAVIRMDHRGCGSGETLSSTVAHAGRSDDVRAVLQHLHECWPDSPISAVGFSMGGNMLLKALGELSDWTAPFVECCVAVAPPIDMHQCVSTSHARYSRWIAKYLWQATLRNVAVRDVALASGRQQPRDLMEYDARVTAPLAGFRDVREYYDHSSAATVLRHISTPTLILAAADDPVINAEIFGGGDWPENVRVHVAEGGGHVGFLSAPNEDPDLRWLDWRIVDWLEHHKLARE